VASREVGFDQGVDRYGNVASTHGPQQFRSMHPGDFLRPGHRG
jgi:hypothetical protein